MNAVTLGIVLTRTTPNDAVQVGVNNSLILSATNGMITNLTLTFANINSTWINNGSFADGRWRISIPSLGYQSPLNDVQLLRLFGDENSDGTVNAEDFANFGNSFGATVSNNEFDFNADGTINAEDFAQFGNRFGMTL